VQFQRQPGDQTPGLSYICAFVVRSHVVILLALLLLCACLGLGARQTHATAVAGGTANQYPYPQCTWWADQRYSQLHGVFVPWRTQSDAWQWTARARQFGWQVSTRASQGAIIDLQPWVQGAYSAGHVAVVEKVYSDGSVLASNMNWGASPSSVTYVHFYPGAGVTFIQR
jgi:N-acetylmuramoyl-L-alanine amidase